MQNTSSVAVFIDAENICYSTLNNYSETPDWAKVVDICKDYGRISSIQAFGDWVKLKNEIADIQSNGIQPVYIPLSQDGKSSLDCYLIVHAMKLFFQNDKVDTFILASGDRDYIPLISELKALGKSVIIFAVPGTLSKDLAAIADQVIHYEHESMKDSGINRIAQDEPDTFINQLIVEVLSGLEDDSVNDRWVNVASIGLALKQRDEGFSHTNYSYNKLSDMLNDIAEIELKFDNYEKTIALARTCNPDDRITNHNSASGIIFSLKDGYGFIQPENGKENIFFHNTKLVNTHWQALNPGDKVTYSTYNTERGLNAENVEKLT